MRSFQDLTFSTRIQDGIPRDNQRDQKGKCLTGSKTLSISLWDFMRSLQDLTFPPRIQGGIQRDNQTGKKGKCLTDRKTLASFYQILWDPFMAQLFSPGSRMASQGTTKGTKKEHVWQVEKPQQVFIWFYEVLPGLHFFHQDPGWDPKGQPKGQKRNMFDKWKNLSKCLFDFVRSSQDFTFPTRIQDGIPRGNQRDQTGKCLTSRKTLASFY